MEECGLVLEGGAMRGLFTVGILDVMMQENLCFTRMAGVSAGAVFGCNFKSGQMGRALRYNLRFCRDPRYCSWRSLLKTGDLFGAEFCYHTLPEELDWFDGEAFSGNPLEFHLVCTDMETGKAVYHRCRQVDSECFEWMRASASMPLVSRIVSIGGRQYLDGAVTDPVPLRFLEETGCSRNIVILTQPAGYVKKPSAAMPLLRLAYRKYPAFLRAMENRHETYNAAIRYAEAQAAAGKALILRPETALPAGRLCRDPEKLRQNYDAGQTLALKHLNSIRAFLHSRI